MSDRLRGPLRNRNARERLGFWMNLEIVYCDSTNKTLFPCRASSSDKNCRIRLGPSQSEIEMMTMSLFFRKVPDEGFFGSTGVLVAIDQWGLAAVFDWHAFIRVALMNPTCSSVSSGYIGKLSNSPA